MLAPMAEMNPVPAVLMPVEVTDPPKRLISQSLPRTFSAESVMFVTASSNAPFFVRVES